MPIYAGTSKAGALMHGTAVIAKVYYGEVLVYQIADEPPFDPCEERYVIDPVAADGLTTGHNEYTIRQKIPKELFAEGSAGKLALTIKAGPNGNVVMQRCTIGISDGTDSGIETTPVTVNWPWGSGGNSEAINLLADEEITSHFESIEFNPACNDLVASFYIYSTGNGELTTFDGLGEDCVLTRKAGDQSLSQSGAGWSAISGHTSIIKAVKADECPFVYCPGVNAGPGFGNAYRRYRILFEEQIGEFDGRIGLREIYLYNGGVEVGNDLYTNGVVTHSGAYYGDSANYTTFGMQAGNAPFGYVGGGGIVNQFIGLKGPGAFAARYLALRTHTAEYRRMPVSFKVQYSDDEFVADIHDAFTSGTEAPWVTNEVRMYDIPDVGAHGSWRIFMQGGQPGNDGYMSLGTLMLTDENGQTFVRYDAIEGANVAGSMRSYMTRSSPELGGYWHIYAFDRQHIERYISEASMPQWVEMIVNAPIVVDSFAIRNDESFRSPKHFRLQGSNITSSTEDDAEWEDVIVVRQELGWGTAELRTYAP